LAARALVGAFVVLLAILLVAARDFIFLGALLVLAGFLLGLLRIALLLFARIVGGLGHGNLLFG
jgi:hypothetical protein